MIRVTMHAVDETGEKRDEVQARIETKDYMEWHASLVNFAEGRLELITDEIH